MQSDEPSLVRPSRGCAGQQPPDSHTEALLRMCTSGPVHQDRCSGSVKTAGQVQRKGHIGQTVLAEPPRAMGGEKKPLLA